MNTINQLTKHEKEGIMHSDRGGLYTSFQYIQKLKELNLIRSMSRSGTNREFLRTFERRDGLQRL